MIRVWNSISVIFLFIIKSSIVLKTDAQKRQEQIKTRSTNNDEILFQIWPEIISEPLKLILEFFIKTSKLTIITNQLTVFIFLLDFVLRFFISHFNNNWWFYFWARWLSMCLHILNSSNFKNIEHNIGTHTQTTLLANEIFCKNW